MPDDIKTYKPEEIIETPFPGEPLIIDTQSQTSTGGNYAPTTTKEKTFPKKKIAVELLSTALNTRSKKVLQEFELQQSGGFKVGDFKEGISGDLRITPNGLTARDRAGITTFAIDGTTGDAIFKGIVRSGSIIAETSIEASDIIGGSININDQFIVTQDGRISIYNETPDLIFDVDFVESIVYVSGMQIGGNPPSGIPPSSWFDGVLWIKDSVNGFLYTFDTEGFVLADARPLIFTGDSAANAPSTHQCALYVTVSGGKHQLNARFATGAVQVIATEP